MKLRQLFRSKWASLISRLAKKREKKRVITIPKSVKKVYSAFYDQRKNVLEGLPEGWGTWRRPIVVVESFSPVSPSYVRRMAEPLSAITEDISIGTLSIYSLYAGSPSSEKSPLLSALVQASAVGEALEYYTDHKPDLSCVPSAKKSLSASTDTGSFLTAQMGESSESEEDLEETEDCQFLTVSPLWRQSLYITTRIKLMPTDLLPRRSSRILSQDMTHSNVF